METKYLEQQREQIDNAMHDCVQQVIAIPRGMRSGGQFNLLVNCHAKLRAQMAGAGVNVLEPDWQIIQ